MNILKLFLWPIRRADAFLARIYDIFWAVIERVQRFLIKMRNQIRPEIRFLNGVSRKVSIIIPNYNGRKYLGECIDSLLHLDFPRESYEIIVVDNSSSDNSSEFILSMYPDVILINFVLRWEKF